MTHRPNWRESLPVINRDDPAIRFIEGTDPR